ncbi:MAG: acylphosphatase [Spirochaetota bacterium]
MSWEIILSGRVQGVGCRYYCARAAKAMGLRGAATNMEDGTVRVILDTDDREQALAYARAAADNAFGLHFYGKISRYEARFSGLPVSGDYEW